MPMTWNIKRILLEAAIIVSLGVMVGLSVNYRMVLNAFSGKVVAAPAQQAKTSDVAAYPVPTALDEVTRALDQGAVIVDARAAELYREAHIPGAVSLPLGDVDERLGAFLAQVPPERTVIAYCSGYGCPDSFDLGMRLLAEGYRDVRVFEGGLPEWEDRGLPVKKEQP